MASGQVPHRVFVSHSQGGHQLPLYRADSCQNWAKSNAMRPDVYNIRKRGKALQRALMELLVM